MIVAIASQIALAVSSNPNVFAPERMGVPLEKRCAAVHPKGAFCGQEAGHKGNHKAFAPAPGKTLLAVWARNITQADET
jgi:hypothetical protein